MGEEGVDIEFLFDLILFFLIVIMFDLNRIEFSLIRFNMKKLTKSEHKFD